MQTDTAESTVIAEPPPGLKLAETGDETTGQDGAAEAETPAESGATEATPTEDPRAVDPFCETAPKPTPTQREADILRMEEEMFDQLRHWEEVDAEWTEAHREAADLKKRAEKEQAKLNRMVRDLERAKRGDYTPSLPFDTAPSEDAPAPEVADESWRETSLEALGLTGKLAETLTEAGLSTLGKIADYTQSGKLLIDIAGIGPGKSDKIEEACAAYWANNPRPSTAEPAATTEAEPAVEPDTEPEEFKPTIRKSRKVTASLTVWRDDGRWFYSLDVKTKTAGKSITQEPPTESRDATALAATNDLVQFLRANSEEAAAQDVEAWMEGVFMPQDVEAEPTKTIADHAV